MIKWFVGVGVTVFVAYVVMTSPHSTLENLSIVWIAAPPLGFGAFVIAWIATYDEKAYEDDREAVRRGYPKHW